MEDKIDRCWRKSSYSGNGGGNCVEVAGQARRVLVRDSKDRVGAVLRFTPGAWHRFAEQLKRSLATGLGQEPVGARRGIPVVGGGFPPWAWGDPRRQECGRCRIVRAALSPRWGELVRRAGWVQSWNAATGPHASFP